MKAERGSGRNIQRPVIGPSSVHPITDREIAEVVGEDGNR